MSREPEQRTRAEKLVEQHWNFRVVPAKKYRKWK
jgi:hypothetical protein